MGRSTGLSTRLPRAIWVPAQTPRSRSAQFATDLPAGKPAWGATAWLQCCGPTTPGQCSAPAAHVGHLPPSGTAWRIGRGQQVWPGWSRGIVASRGSGARAVQLHAEPQPQQQRSTEQPQGQGSAAAPGRPGRGHGGDPSLRLRSGYHPQLQAACRAASPRAPVRQLWQLPSRPGVGPPSSLRQRRPQSNLILPSRRARSGGLGTPRPPKPCWVSLGVTGPQSLTYIPEVLGSDFIYWCYY